MSNQQYFFKDGKLILAKRPLHNRLRLVLGTLFLICALAIGLVYYIYRDIYLIPPADMAVISREDYERFLKFEQGVALRLESNTQAYEAIANENQLTEIFDKVFTDVSLPLDKKKAYLSSVSKWSSHYSMPPLLVLSIIWRESGFDEKSMSKANAKGPMQVIYKYHPEKLARLGKKEEDLHTIDVGISVGVEILREYFDKYKRNIFRALFAYVGGEHRSYAQDILTRYFNARIYLEEKL